MSSKLPMRRRDALIAKVGDNMIFRVLGDAYSEFIATANHAAGSLERIADALEKLEGSTTIDITPKDENE